MNWFTNKKSKKRNTASSRQPWDPVRTLNGLKFLGVVVGLVVMIAGWRSSRQALSAYVAHQNSPAGSLVQIELVDAPPWMNQIVRDSLCRLASEQISIDPLDQRSLQRAVTAVSNSPWVERVWRAQRTQPRTVQISADYREPVALVESTDGYHLVNLDRRRLPGLYLKHQLAQLGLPVIRGVASPPALYGEVWPGDDLVAGLSLLAWLSEEPYFHQIRSIDVNGRDDRNRIHLVLRTEQGMVRWGLGPNIEQVVEPNPVTKRQWLAKVYNQRGTIDAGGKIVDVYGPAIFVHQPVAYDEREAATGYSWR